MSDFVSFTKTWHNKPYAAIDPAQPKLSAAGKFVVITGGGTGIGLAIAIAFAQAGAKYVAIFGRRLDKLESAAKEITSHALDANVRVIFAGGDTSKRASLDAAVANLTKQAAGAKVDILVHSAGIASDLGTVIEYDEAEFRRGLENNLMGSFHTLQAFAPVLATNAHLYHISSGMAHISPFPSFWTYSVVKAGITKMFDYIQQEHPDWHVVQVQPGVIATGINERFDVVSQDDREFFPSCLSLALNGIADLFCVSTANLAGQFLVWLASPEASFLKSKFVWVNWDVDELKARADEIKDSLLLRVLLHGAVM
jgi:NAD(P)-dependent dehydrogenase (short-subunit alcohol dehydrogenase family)